LLAQNEQFRFNIILMGPLCQKYSEKLNKVLFFQRKAKENPHTTTFRIRFLLFSISFHPFIAASRSPPSEIGGV
jgi:hypothetical protein